MDADQILSLTDHGYTVTFEASGLGDYFCLLRQVTTMELVNCVIANSVTDALDGAAEWAESGRPGNGTSARPTVEVIIQDLSDVKLYGRDTRRELLAIIGDLRQQMADHTARLGRLENVPWPPGPARVSFSPNAASHPYPYPVSPENAPSGILPDSH
jgi:hypothetical protein